MATFTTNYNLRKPNPAPGGDFVNVATDLNANWDILDTELKSVSNRVANYEPFVQVGSYTPGVTGLNVGATRNVEYIQIGKLLIGNFYIQASGVATGSISFDLPGGMTVNTATGVANGPNAAVGVGTILDQGTGYFAGMPVCVAAGATSLTLFNAAGTQIGVGVPMTWANTDVLSGMFVVRLV